VNATLARWWRKRWSIAVTSAVVLFTIFVVVLPIWMVVVNSFKPLGEAAALGLDLPRRWEVVENYRDVIEAGRLFHGFGNTLLVVVPSVIGIVILSAAASWVFARSKRRTVSIVYYLAIAGIILPVAIVASIRVMELIHLRGTFPGLVLFYMGTSISVGIFLMTGFIKTIPIELEEAARIDGAGTFTVFARVVFPLLRPIVATLSFLMVLFLWNDFFTPFFLLPGQENQTLMLGLFSFVSRTFRQTEWHLVFADVVLVSMPLIIVYFFTQRWIVTGLLGAGVDK
jgi:raffinose/stachyose/melibiose transport system permease protein